MQQLASTVRTLYPYQSHFLDLEGQAYHYIDEGKGEPLLMVHGNPTWSFYYRGLIAGFKDRYRTIAPDHIGCGLSDKPNDEHYTYTLKQRIDDLEHLVDHLGLGDNLTLVLHDWGGIIGMGYAARHPHKVKRLIIGNTGAFPLPAGKRLPPMLKLGRDSAIGSLLIRGLNAFCLAAASTCVKRRPLAQAVREGYLAPYDSWDHRRAVLRFVQDIPLSAKDPAFAIVAEVERTLAQFRQVPTLILWGAQDFVFDDFFLEEWRARLPQAEVHRFADVGHYVFEDAAEEVRALIKDFLERHP